VPVAVGLDRGGPLLDSVFCSRIEVVWATIKR